jgi:hypothetical protein
MYPDVWAAGNSCFDGWRHQQQASRHALFQSGPWLHPATAVAAAAARFHANQFTCCQEMAPFQRTCGMLVACGSGAAHASPCASCCASCCADAVDKLCRGPGGLLAAQGYVLLSTRADAGSVMMSSKSVCKLQISESFGMTISQVMSGDVVYASAAPEPGIVPPLRLVLLPSGMLLLQDAAGVGMWSSGSACNGSGDCFIVKLLDDCSLEVRDGSGTRLWSSAVAAALEQSGSLAGGIAKLQLVSYGQRQLSCLHSNASFHSMLVSEQQAWRLYLSRQGSADLVSSDGRGLVVWRVQPPKEGISSALMCLLPDGSLSIVEGSSGSPALWNSSYSVPRPVNVSTMRYFAVIIPQGSVRVYDNSCRTIWTSPYVPSPKPPRAPTPPPVEGARLVHKPPGRQRSSTAPPAQRARQRPPNRAKLVATPPSKAAPLDSVTGRSRSPPTKKRRSPPGSATQRATRPPAPLSKRLPPAGGATQQGSTRPPPPARSRAAPAPRLRHPPPHPAGSQQRAPAASSTRPPPKPSHEVSGPYTARTAQAPAQASAPPRRAFKSPPPTPQGPPPKQKLPPRPPAGASLLPVRSPHATTLPSPVKRQATHAAPPLFGKPRPRAAKAGGAPSSSSSSSSSSSATGPATTWQQVLPLPQQAQLVGSCKQVLVPGSPCGGINMCGVDAACSQLVCCRQHTECRRSSAFVWLCA